MGGTINTKFELSSHMEMCYVINFLNMLVTHYDLNFNSLYVWSVFNMK